MDPTLLELLNKISSAALVIFVIMSMAAIGMGHGIGQILVSTGF
jgi:hypothetical protein